jgi:predicted transcriptional regulator
MTGDLPDAESLALEAVNRGSALELLAREGAMDRSSFMAGLDVSRTTVHRIVRGLEGAGLLTETSGEIQLTPLGRTVADAVTEYRGRIEVAHHLEPFLDTLADRSVTLEVDHFADARVSVAEPSNPYAPLERFMELLVDSETLRGFDTTTVAPIFVDRIRDEILDGMTTDVIYPPDVVETMVDAYPKVISAAAKSGELTLSKTRDLPFGLAIFDDRIGLGGYDADSGMLSVFVDTEDPDARAWAHDLYESYRERAETLEAGAIVQD